MTRVRLFVLFALLAALSMVPTGSATASCAAPSVTRPAEPVSRSGTLEVRGAQFVEGCDDGGGSEGLGCGPGPDVRDDAVKPLEAVALRLRQGDRVWRLDSADASASPDGSFGAITWKFQLPAGAKTGPAVLETDYSQPVRILIGP